MNKYKHHLFIVLTIITQSCQNTARLRENDQSVNDSLTLVETKNDLRFELDEFTGLITQSLQYVDYKDSSFLFFLNRHVNSLYSYNFQTKKRKILNFKKEGPNGVGKLNGFYFHNFDSIFLVSADFYKITLVVNPYMDKNKIFRTMKMTPRKIGSNSAKPLGFTGNRPYFIKNKLYILGVPDIDPTTSDFFNKGQNLQIMNLMDSTKKSKSLFTTDYKHTWSPYFYDYYHDFVRPKNSFVYSPPVSDSVISMSLNEDITYNYAGSRYIKEIQPMSTDFSDGVNREAHYYSNASYFMILYDKYNKLFYRFIELPNQKAIDDNDPRKASKIASIIILNDKLEKVGEKKLAPYEFFPIMSFVTSEGLYISQPLLNSDKSGVEENILRFVLFNVKKNE